MTAFFLSQGTVSVAKRPGRTWLRTNTFTCPSGLDSRVTSYGNIFLLQTSSNTTAVSTKILHKCSSLIFKCPQHNVTVVAQQSTKTSCNVVVVHRQVFFARHSAADGTATSLRLQHFSVLPQTNAKRLAKLPISFTFPTNPIPSVRITLMLPKLLRLFGLFAFRTILFRRHGFRQSRSDTIISRVLSGGAFFARRP